MSEAPTQSITQPTIQPAAKKEPAPSAEVKRLSDAEFKHQLVETMPHLRAFARSLASDPVLADDIVQDTLVKAWSARKRFDASKSMRIWAFVILRNTYFSQFRRKKFEGIYDAEEAAQILVAEPEQEDRIHLSDLHSALMELSDDQREAIVLVGAGGFSYKQASEIAGCAEGTMKSRVSRGRKDLVTILERKYISQNGRKAQVSAKQAMTDIVDAIDQYVQVE